MNETMEPAGRFATADGAVDASVGGAIDRHADGSAVGHRLSAAGLITGFITGLPQLFFPIVAVLYGVGKSDRGMILMPFLIAGMLLASLLFRWIGWTRFRYYTGDEDIRIESGLISRTARSIPYERIQDVGIKQKPLARIFGLGEVTFETGSGAGDEATLSYISITEAERLRTLVRAQKTGDRARLAAPAPSNDGANAGGGAALFAMDSRRVLTLGLYSFSLVIFAVLGGAAQQLDFLLPFDFHDIGGWLDQGDALNDIGWRFRIFAAISALLALVAVGCITGIIRTFLREHGFRLDITPRGFRRRRGLLTLTDVVMPIHRVQAATIFTGPIRKLCGWYGMQFISLAGDSASGGKKQDSDHMVAPLATVEEIERIAKAAQISLPDANTGFSRGMLRYWLNVIWGIAALLTGVAAILIMLIGAGLYALLLLALVPFAAIIPILDWRFRAYRLDSDLLLVRRGWWRQQMTIAPHVKIQTIEIAQGPIARMQGLCKIHFGIAGGTMLIAGLKLADAQAIAARVMETAAAVDYSRIAGAGE